MSVTDTAMEDQGVEEIVLSGDAIHGAEVDDVADDAIGQPEDISAGSDGEQMADETLTSGGDGEAAQDEVVELASDFVAELLAPVSEDMPVGNDPHYGDRFYEIKREIDKLSGNDYAKVISAARAILREEGKDLRVAAYHLLAAVYVDGVQGLIDGLALYEGLLDAYGRYCYPSRDGMRQSAVRWLGNRKMQAYCEEKLADASLEQLEYVQNRISAINTLLDEQFGDEIEPWTALNEILDKFTRKARDDASRKSASNSGSAPLASAMPGAGGQQPAESGGAAEVDAAPGTEVPAALPDNAVQPVSEQQLLRHARELIRYLTEANDYGRATGMARAVLWGNLQMPPANGNATSVPGPRASDLLEIRQLLGDGEFASAFTLGEALLFGPGGRLSLDLQFFTVQAAKGMKQREVAQIIENATVGLIQRLPRIVDLQFEDGTPFAQADTRRWLEGLASEGSGAVATPAIDDEVVKKVVGRAEKAAGKGNLSKGLAVFAAEKTSHPLTAFRLQMEMAGFCLAHQRADLAVPAFEKLMRRASNEHLASWNPELLASLAKGYRDALQAMAEQVEEERKPDYERRIEELSAEMCQADLVQASRFL